MKSTIRSTVFAVALAAVSSGASALQVWTTSGPTSTAPNVTCNIDFDGSSCAGVSYSFGPDSQNIVTGKVMGSNGKPVAVQPVGSTGNYLAIGPAHGQGVTITIDFTSFDYNYFGFFGGSLDKFNLITFEFSDGQDVDTLSYTGTDISGMTSAFGNVYWNLLLETNQFFRSIVLSSSSNAFETDNHSFGNSYRPPEPPTIVGPTQVPLPGTVSLLGLGLLGLGALKRRQAA